MPILPKFQYKINCNYNQNYILYFVYDVELGWAR